MAKSQTARTMKNDPLDDPFLSVIPDRAGEQRQAEEAPAPVEVQRPAPALVAAPVAHQVAKEPEPKGGKKEKVTVHLSHELAERVKNAAYWNPRLTVAGIAEMGIQFAIEQVEKENGGPYPKRESELKGGRPLGS